MHAVTGVSSARRPRGVPGVRRYRVWWLEGRVEVVPATRTPRRGRWPMARMLLALGVAAVALGAGLGYFPVWLAVGLVAGAVARLRAPWARHRAYRLRRRGARPGPWVWAIDAESAACTARIRADAAAPAAQARRTPSMRIQSPSCSQRRSSNHAA